MKPRYIIGLDLGTTNTVVAYVDLEQPEHAVEHFEILQLTAPGEMGRAAALPSFLYLPGAYDLPEGSLALSWDAERSYAAGRAAQQQGARVPGRLVASAKSWLSHGGVDRTADILPWNAPHEVDQISPVEASARLLRHVREAWNEAMARTDAAHRLERQRVVLTVPASFDEVARNLTVEAAQRAGIPDVVLIEEPLAAFYAWMDPGSESGAGSAEQKRAAMEDGALVLVCDVGGGTSDFSVIGVRRDAEGAQFERLAVGEHLMLGGDNMDHALGRSIESELTGQNNSLDVQRWHQLVHSCRSAKETLLGTDPPEEASVSVAAKGSSLVGGTLTGTLERADVEQLVLEGFFPETDFDTDLQEKRSAGLTEMGLPYEADAAITRHLAAFWRRFQPLLSEKTGRDTPRPDYILFNGGVFTPAALRERLLRIVGGWFGGDAPEELTGTRLDRAVAHGAASYGLVRRGERQRVGSGTARAYYVGVAAEDGASANGESGQPAVCLVPRGVEEGFAAQLEGRPIEALANQPAVFHLFSSATRTGDAFGEVVRLGEDEAQALPPIRTVLRFGKKNVQRALPVELGVRLTEVGTLELWCQSLDTEHRWELAFDVRASDAVATPQDEGETDTVDLAKIEAAEDALRATFEGDAAPGEALWSRLEETLDAPRDEWPRPVLRTLADALIQLPKDESPKHEVTWFDLLGWTLRPGYGDEVDDWRMSEAWKRYLGGLDFELEETCRLAWWRFWRRVGAGLPGNKQAQLYYDARSYIQHRVRTRKTHPLYPRRLSDDEKHAAWQTLATFERLPDNGRTAVGQLVMEQLQQRVDPDMLWALSRLGTRRPLYGPLDSLLPAEDTGGWLKTLLDMKIPRRLRLSEDFAFTLAVLAQRTGDRARDVSDAVRQQVLGRLRRMEAGDGLAAPLEDADAALPSKVQDWLTGEPLPAAGGAALPQQAGFVVAGDG